MKSPKALFLVDLLLQIDQELMEVLTSLSIDDWSLQTIAPEWKVKDVAAHLLDGNLRTLSMLRDNYYLASAVDLSSYRDLVNYLNGLNADWVKAISRLSPQIIIELLRQSGEEYCAFLKTLDPHGIATFSVAWAGEQESKNWFHIAREYTEKWTHQQQIRLAIGQDAALLKEKWYLPYLATSMRGLAHHYRKIKAEEGSLIKFCILGENEKNWWLQFQNEKWELLLDLDKMPNCEVRIKDEFAWRIFSKGIDKKMAIAASEIKGQENLGLHIFEMIAVMA